MNSFSSCCNHSKEKRILWCFTLWPELLLFVSNSTKSSPTITTAVTTNHPNDFLMPSEFTWFLKARASIFIAICKTCQCLSILSNCFVLFMFFLSNFPLVEYYFARLIESFNLVIVLCTTPKSSCLKKQATSSCEYGMKGHDAHIRLSCKVPRVLLLYSIVLIFVPQNIGLFLL